MGILSFVSNLFKRGSNIDIPEVYRPERPQKSKVYGSHGRLEIQNLFISVPLYNALDARDMQRVVDDQHSAVFFHFGVQDAIADHSCQENFNNLNLARPGMIAVIDEKDKQTSYKMIKSQIGHIRITPLGNRLFDQDWQQVATQNAGGLCIYTCIGKSSDDVMDVRLTYWQPVESGS